MVQPIPVQGRCLFDRLPQGAVRLVQRGTQDRGDILLPKLTGKHFVESGNDQIAGNVSRGMAPHSVSHDNQRGGVGPTSTYIVEIGSEERIFLVVTRTIDLVTSDFRSRVPRK